MEYINKITLQGNVVNVHETDYYFKVVLCTVYKLKDDEGNPIIYTDFHNVWITKPCTEEINRGDYLNITGRLTYKKYESSEGNIVTMPNIIAYEVKKVN